MLKKITLKGMYGMAVRLILILKRVKWAYLKRIRSPNLAQIPEQFRDPAKIKGNYSSAIYLGVLGFGINPERLKKLNLPTPKCWKDLADPRIS